LIAGSKNLHIENRHRKIKNFV